MVDIKVDVQEDVAVQFGHAGGNCISPPEIEFEVATIVVTIISEDQINELVSFPIDWNEVSVETEVVLDKTTRQVVITLNVQSTEILRKSAGVYDRVNF